MNETEYALLAYATNYGRINKDIIIQEIEKKQITVSEPKLCMNYADTRLPS